MKKIDKTKENIKVDELDEKTRKKMFEKFVQAGGKVIEEREKPSIRQTKIVKPAVRTVSQTPQRTVPKEPKQPKIQSDEMFETWLQKKLSKLFIRVRLFLLGVSGLSAEFFKPRFMENLIHSYKTALLQFQVQYFHIFNPQHSKQIISKLDQINPLYYELIVMISNIFDRTRFNEIEALYQSTSMVSMQKLKNHLMSMYKSLYILYPYIELIELAYNNALEIQASLEKQKSTHYEKRKYIRNSLYITFYKFLPRLHSIFCHYYNVYIDITSPYIRTILQISDSDLPGKRKASKPAEKAEEQIPKEQEEQPQIPQHILKGLSLMNLSTNDIVALFPKDSYVQVNPADKALITYALFKKFDDEFSIILTTNKIKYNIQFTDAGKIDYKNRLTDCYNELRKVTESFEEYMHVLETYERIRAEKPLNNAQYIEYTKRLTQLEKKKKVESKNMRMTTKAIMDKIATQLDILIHDMDEENKIIENPQDFLEFDINVESVHILQNKKVYEAIHLAYFYASALSYRLSEGDLSGDIEFKEGETPLGIGSQKKDAHSTLQEEKKQNGSSVIKELEDLF
ncbi:MAG: hypothetical protein N3F66_04380 [Spirochaetes bacterium]|nr:hypothetical protein [Spirochaetota bacterium]